jgi:hypothetical protein
MKPNRRIALIAVAAIAIAGAWCAREERCSPCAGGACRLSLMPADNTWTTAAPPAAVASTNETLHQAITESLAKPWKS